MLRIMNFGNPQRIGLALGLALLIFVILWRSCTLNTSPNGQITVAYDSSSIPPARGQEKNIQAFIDEILFRIASQAHFEIRVVSPGNYNLFNGLDSRIFDAIVSTRIPDIFSAPKYSFSQPLYKTGSVLIVANTSPIKSLDDLSGKRLGMQRGSSTTFNLLRDRPAIAITPFDNLTTGVDDLIRGRFDALVMDQLTAYALLEGYFGGQIKVVSSPLTNDGIRLVMLRNETQVQKFDNAIDELKKSGVYGELLKKWGLRNPDILP